MDVTGVVNPKAEKMNRARNDLRRVMIEGGLSEAEVHKNLSVMERFIDACIDWKLDRKY